MWAVLVSAVNHHSCDGSGFAAPLDDFYVRGIDSPLRALSCVPVPKKSDYASGTATTLVLLDGITFNPPPGAEEFTFDYVFRRDLDIWLGAIESWAKGRAVYVGVTDPFVVGPVSDPTWKDTVRGALRETTWTAPAKQPCATAAEWMTRALKSVPGGIPQVVWIGGLVFPEQLEGAEFQGAGAGRLLAPETYWKEEQLVAQLLAAGTSLTVIAPEARFCDVGPLETLPELPWAPARPLAPKGAVAEFPTAGGNTPAALAKLRTLRDDLRLQGSDTSELDRAIKFLEDAGAGRSVAGIDSSYLRRFVAYETCGHPRVRDRLLFDSGVPGAYGYWPLARVASASGGRYVFYPYERGPWLDVCPLDIGLARELAPDLSPRKTCRSRAANDPAVAVMTRAAELLEPVTSYSTGVVKKKGWSSLRGIANAFDPRHLLRDKPARGGQVDDEDRDDAVGGHGPHITRREMSASIAKRLRSALPVYDQASRMLDDALRDFEAHPRSDVSRRSLADLRLMCYWTEGGAFDMESEACYLDDVDRYAPVASDPGKLTITSNEAVRMSDCLPSYSGQTIAPDEEARLRGHDPLQGLGLASSVLFGISTDDDRCRAQRRYACVEAGIDSRVRHRLARAVAAAKSVMEHEARSPWGWEAYYSVLERYVWWNSNGLPIPPNRATGDDQPPPPTTPGGPSTGK